jgi:hypothetical protein
MNVIYFSDDEDAKINAHNLAHKREIIHVSSPPRTPIWIDEVSIDDKPESTPVDTDDAYTYPKKYVSPHKFLELASDVDLLITHSASRIRKKPARSKSVASTRKKKVTL